MKTYKTKLIEKLREVNEIDEDFKECWILKERHLRMYLEEKWWNVVFEEWSYFWWDAKLDNTKSLENQDEEVLKAILNYLKEI